MKKTITTTILLTAMTAMTAQAEFVNLEVVNHSFENATAWTHFDGNARWNDSVLGWVETGDVGTLETSGFMPYNVDGNNNVWLNNGTIEQTLNSTLEVGTYALDLHIGARTDTPYGRGEFELLAGDQSLFRFGTAIPEDWSWFHYQHTVNAGDAGIGEQLRIRIVSFEAQTLVDNVQLMFDSPNAVANVSVPAVFGGLGLLLMAGLKRRQR